LGNDAQENNKMARSRQIEKSKFHAINRDIKAGKIGGNYSSQKIATKHDVSRGTVQTIAQAKTWPAFLNHKQLKATQSAKRKASALKESQQSGVPTPQVEKTLAKDLRSLEINPVEYVTTKQFTDALASLKSGNATDYKALKTQLDEQFKRIDYTNSLVHKIMRRRPRWFREG
jgi:hypothetical protein